MCCMLHASSVDDNVSFVWHLQSKRSNRFRCENDGFATCCPLKLRATLGMALLTFGACFRGWAVWECGNTCFTVPFQVSQELSCFCFSIQTWYVRRFGQRQHGVKLVQNQGRKVMESLKLGIGWDIVRIFNVYSVHPQNNLHSLELKLLCLWPW